MPSKSPQQHRLMEAVAHDPKFAKKAGIPVAVGKEFAAADAAKGPNQNKPKFQASVGQPAHAKQLAAALTKR